MTDAMQTGMIRTRIVAVEIQDNGYVRDTNKGIMIGHLTYEGPSALDYFDSIANLTALDSLAGATSEDAKAFAIEIAHEAFDPWFFNKVEKQYMGAFDHDAAAALIQARDSIRDERIRRERDAAYADVFKWLFGEEGDFPESEPGHRYNWRGELRTRLGAIKPEATNGQ